MSAIVLTNININNGQNMQTVMKELASAGLVVQNYCTGIQQQPILYLPDDVQAKMPDVNGYIKISQSNATKYLNEVQPQILSVITDIDGFSVMFPTFSQKINGYLEAWSTGSQDNKQKALDAIDALKKVIQGKSDSVKVVCTGIGNVETLFNTDVAHFREVSQACADHITGDKGELKELEKQLSSIDGKIAAASVGVGVSGLAIAGGVFMIVVGSVASFVTAGTSTPLVVAGSVLTGAGVAGLVASSVSLAKLIENKGDLLREQAKLESYVSALEGCKSNVDLLFSGAQETAGKLSNMKAAWDLLGADLTQIEGTLKDAQSYSDVQFMVQTYFDTAIKQWNSVNSDIKVIKDQMTGVQVKKVESNNILKAGVGIGAALGEINTETVRRMVS